MFIIYKLDEGNDEQLGILKSIEIMRIRLPAVQLIKTAIDLYKMKFTRKKNM